MDPVTLEDRRGAEEASGPSSALFDGETLREDQTPILQFAQISHPGAPLVVFLSGGGHLARIAYGHPTADRKAFLNYWLQRSKLNFLAISHPLGHPVFGDVSAALSIRRWIDSICKSIRQLVESGDCPNQIIILAWSMSARFANILKYRMDAHGLQMELFVSLAGAVPFPGLAGNGFEKDCVSNSGLRSFHLPKENGVSLLEDWCEELDYQAELNGNIIISMKEYCDLYVGDNPVNLHGEELRLKNNRIVKSRVAAIRDLKSADFGQYPFIGAIVPDSARDFLHAALDKVNWGFINTHNLATCIRRQADMKSLDPGHWGRLRDVILRIPDRMCRQVQGGHFFFLGALGARATVEAMLQLRDEVSQLKSEMRELGFELRPREDHKLLLAGNDKKVSGQDHRATNNEGKSDSLVEGHQSNHR